MTPAIEIAYHRDCACVGSPDREIDALYAVDCAGMRSHFFIETVMLSLAEQIQVEIAEQRWNILLSRRHLSWRVIMSLWYCHSALDLVLST